MNAKIGFLHHERLLSNSKFDCIPTRVSAFLVTQGALRATAETLTALFILMISE